MKSELVKTATTDNLILNGLFVEGQKDKPALIFIHGYEGDFFSHKWISLIGEKFAENEMTFLTAQNRGTAMHQELITTEGNAFYCGAHFEKLEDAYKDIDAWINFLLTKGYSNIILAGHSLGTIKVTRYIFEGKNKDKVQKLLLLAPFDKNFLLENAAKQIGKTVEELIPIAKAKVEEGKGQELAPYGFDDVPHSYENFLSWADQSEIGRMFDFHDKEYEFPLLSKINIPVKVIVGDKDEFLHPSNPETPEEAIEILQKNIPNIEYDFIKGSGHSYRGYEKELVESVLNYLQK